MKLMRVGESGKEKPGVRLDDGKVIDVSGVVKAFDGAFLAEYLRTGDPFAAGRYANVAAGLSTEGYGAVAPMPRRAEVETALRRRAFTLL